MKRSLIALTLAVGLSAALAQDYTLTLAPVGGAATGSGGGTLTLSGSTLTFNDVTYLGLSGNSTAAHIHGPLPATGVLFNLATLTTFGGTSGSFSGNVTGLSAQNIADLNAGNLYVNIHSSTFGGGEISGIITLVPEPGTLALLGLGLGALAWHRRGGAKDQGRGGSM